MRRSRYRFLILGPVFIVVAFALPYWPMTIAQCALGVLCIAIFWLEGKAKR